MKKTDRILKTGAVISAVVLALGVTHVFILRFRAGDIYPPYSSLRADPLGAEVLYESLKPCGVEEVRRNYDADPAASLDSEAALFQLGMNTRWYYRADRDYKLDLCGFAARGGRLVVTFLPENDPVSGTRRNNEKANGSSGEKEDETAEDCACGPCGTCGPRPSGPVKYLNVGFNSLTSSRGQNALLSEEYLDFPLPRTLSCHSSLCFTNLTDRWRAVYRVNGRPVMIENSTGPGSIVLSTLSYPLSNEAMKDERRPVLLAWLVGAKTRVVFDESVHGVRESPTVATLVRRHRLYWLVTGLALLALLFVWRNAVSLVPADPETGPRAARGPAPGKDSTSGLINLLERNIPPHSVIRTCAAEWNRTSASRPGLKITEPGGADPVSDYNAIAEAIRKKGRKL
ncbi:MAG: DUF4350 domain-containing protein [Kiritimatiellia bacterium]